MSFEEMTLLGKRAKKASTELAVCTTAQKNRALLSISDALLQYTEKIMEANRLDLASAKENGISSVMADRLMLNEARISSIAHAVKQVVELEDPIGSVDTGKKTENGLFIIKMRVPLGVVGIIYESRPNVTVDAAVLCLKSSNVAFLRGGKEAIHTNQALVSIMRDAVEAVGLNPDVILLVEDTSRESSAQMMQMTEYLDVLIPRGGAGLIRAVTEKAKVPVIQTGVGNCHVYVDSYADLEMAVRIVDNAKTNRPSVCNACESLLVHSDVAEQFLPMIAKAFETHRVEILGCERTRAVLGKEVQPATEEDYATEFLDYKISVKVVDSLEEAIAHIAKYTTYHSECIVTNSLTNANLFTDRVDAAAVYVNASTRFTDGGEFGLGAEIGISTQKLHARGPMGLREMTTMKYVINGNGQIR